MVDNLEEAVARHYGVGDITARILAAIVAAGLDPVRVTSEQLAPYDEFHLGGRPATAHAVARMALKTEDHVLDVGCGLGGASRYVASAIGCRVTGIDLTPEYVAAAQELSRRAGLVGRVSHLVASALAMPFEDRTFDAALTIHIAMNIKDRSGFYREIARVLKPGAPFCLFDVMRGATGEVAFPVPWAETPATSHLTTPQEMQALLRDSGFEVREIEDRTAFARDWLLEGARATAAGAPPPGPGIVMGASAPEKLRNLRASLESGAVAPVLMVARRAS